MRCSASCPQWLTRARAAVWHCAPLLLRCTILVFIIGALAVLRGQHKHRHRQDLSLCGPNGTLFVVPGAGNLSSDILRMGSWARVFRVVYVATNCSAPFPRDVRCVPARRLTRHPHNMFSFAETACPNRLVALTHADVALRDPEPLQAIVRVLREHQAQQEARNPAYRGWAVSSSRRAGTEGNLTWQSLWMWHSERSLVPALLPMSCFARTPLFKRLLAVGVDPDQRELIELDGDSVLAQRQPDDPDPWYHSCLNPRDLFRPHKGDADRHGPSAAGGAFGAAPPPSLAIGSCGHEPCLRPHPLRRDAVRFADPGLIRREVEDRAGVRAGIRGLLSGRSILHPHPPQHH